MQQRMHWNVFLVAPILPVAMQTSSRAVNEYLEKCTSQTRAKTLVEAGLVEVRGPSQVEVCQALKVVTGAANALRSAIENLVTFGGSVESVNLLAEATAANREVDMKRRRRKTKPAVPPSDSCSIDWRVTL